MTGVVDFEAVKAAVGKEVIIDVRNRDEAVQHGQIVNSYCVPLPEVEDAFALDDGAFKAKYGFDKPSAGTPIITHCMKGGRAQKAADALLAKGYQNIRVYKGSYTDWAAKGGESVKPGKPFTP